MSVGPEPVQDDRGVARLFGAMLMVVGGLILALSGLCSAGFVGMALIEAASSPGGSGALTILPMVLVFGGVPMAVGFGVFSLGRGLYRGPKAAP